MLVDMEIPAWDERFLAEYDPVAMADHYAQARASAVMFSCKALTGLCFWPTEVGEMHPGLRGRDVVSETVTALAERGIAGCAYYGVIYDNWAFETHPEWRLEPVGGWRRRGNAFDRHGTCCPNNPGYRDYVEAQIADLYGRYEFSCAFCDMSFWPHVCECRHCRERLQAEAGLDLPMTVDWLSADWCAFQAARERWIHEFQGLVTGAMRRARPGIAVFHNFAKGPTHWLQAVPFSVTEHSDFLGGDLYGDEVEQLLVTKLMSNLSRSRPVEYMTFATTSFLEHVQLKSAERLRGQMLAAVAESSACVFVDAIDPVGTANPGNYAHVRSAFESALPWEPHLGGEPVEDVAVYFSNESKLDLAENGTPLADLVPSREDFPHLKALKGACRALQRAHVAFGVITSRQLDVLDRYRVVVLPNVTRMDEREVEAIRAYVHGGGRVYASAGTSLVDVSGTQHPDFMLADVFGVRLQGEEPAGIAYARPAEARTRHWIAPQRYLSVQTTGSLARVRPAAGAEILATLSLPYAHPHTGDVKDHLWASIHSYPPWEDSDSPVIVEHAAGAGRVIWTAFDLERDETSRQSLSRGDADAGERVFAAAIRSLLGDGWSVACDTHPRVTMSAFHQREQSRIRISLLNPPPAVVTGATLRVRPPAGTRFTTLEDLAAGASLPFEVDGEGTLHHTFGAVPELLMVAARYEDG